MADLDVIIPVFNEEKSIAELVARVDESLNKANISHNIIFIDDHSTDGTVNEIKKASSNHANHESNIIYCAADSNPRNNSSVKVFLKKGKKGKAYSILEGSKYAKSDYVCMIDGDLQYPPEAIPALYKLAKEKGMVVARRSKNGTGFLRKWGSAANVLIFEKFLLGMKCDTQSGLKVFKREIVSKLKKDEVTAWTLDMPLLKKATDLGYEIASHDISFNERKNGESKIHFVKASTEIAWQAMRLRFKRSDIYKIRNRDSNSKIGSGVVHKGRKFITHTHLPNTYSALVTFATWQKIAILSVVLSIFVALIINPISTLVILLGALSIIYLIDLVFSTNLLLKSLHFPPEVKFTDEQIAGLNEKTLPTYSILCPLYKEANVLEAFVNSIKQIDWPKDKLDVQLLLEEDDVETIQKANELKLPEYFSICVVPDSLPKTKPKACNYGFEHSKGEYVVIYDAEDRPDPLQLKKAYLAFAKLDSRVVCLQSKLNYYNTDQNILTKLFTAEYSLWFDLVLPGLQSINTTIPLGGTSNHFKANVLKYLHAWDPFNVTEDCDLGTRLFKAGFKTALIDSTTYEEANSRMKSWIKQRSRWIKGYLQTYLVHMRDPIDFYKKHGLHALIFQLVIGMRMSFILINPCLWVMTASYFMYREQLGPTIESLYPPFTYYIAVFTLVFGNFVYFYNYMIGLAHRKQWGVMKYVFLVPFYWLMTSASAAIAFYQIIVKPHHWEKTQHGLHLPGAKSAKRRIRPEIDIRISISTEFPSKVIHIPNFLFGFLKRNFIEYLELAAKIPENNHLSEGKMRILLLNWRDTKHSWAGGSETYIHEIAKRWAERGHSVTLLCGWDGKTSRYEFVDGIQVIRRGGFYTVYPLVFFYYLVKLRSRFDVVVDCENGIPFFTPLYAQVSKLRLIHHVHQEVFRKHLKFPLSSLALFLESKVVPYFYKGIPIVTVSESSKNDIVARGWGDENIDIVNPGIDPSSFIRGEKSSQPSFVYLGRLKPYKNIDQAIYAFADIVKKYPDSTFSIAGTGESLDELMKLANILGLKDSVKFYGRVNDEQRADLLAQSWVAIQPSLVEGWGITVIEANASATPVIASDVKGLRDSVVDGVTGMLFPPNDIEKLTFAMEKIIIDHDYRKSLSTQAYQWSTKFNWNNTSLQFESVIKSRIEKEVEYIPAIEPFLEKQ